MNRPTLLALRIMAVMTLTSCGHIVAPPRDGFDSDGGGVLCSTGATGPWIWPDIPPPANTVQCHPWQTCTALPVVGFECRP